MKKVLRFGLILLLLLTSVPSGVFAIAKDYIDSGYTKIWELDKSNKVIGYHQNHVYLKQIKDDFIIIKKIYVVDSKEVWFREIKDKDYQIIISDDGSVIIYDLDLKLFCLGIDGEISWIYKLQDIDCANSCNNNMSVFDDKIFISRAGSDNPKKLEVNLSYLTVIDLNSGEIVWDKKTYFGIKMCFAKSDEKSFWSDGRNAYSFDENGNLLWKKYYQCNIIPNIGSNNVCGEFLYFASHTWRPKEFRLTVVNQETGDVVFEYRKLPQSFPHTANDGKLYIDTGLNWFNTINLDEFDDQCSLEYKRGSYSPFEVFDGNLFMKLKDYDYGSDSITMVDIDSCEITEVIKINQSFKKFKAFLFDDKYSFLVTTKKNKLAYYKKEHQ